VKKPQTVTIRLSPGQREKLERLAKKRAKSVSEVIRLLIDEAKE
jgi:predicted transcriptional regulator